MYISNIIPEEGVIMYSNDDTTSTQCINPQNNEIAYHALLLVIAQLGLTGPQSRFLHEGTVALKETRHHISSSQIVT